MGSDEDVDQTQQWVMEPSLNLLKEDLIPQKFLKTAASVDIVSE